MALSPRMLTALADALEGLCMDAASCDDKEEREAVEQMQGAEDVIFEQRSWSESYKPLDHERRIVDATLELLENRLH